MQNAGFHTGKWQGFLTGLTVLFCVGAIADSNSTVPVAQISDDYYEGLYQSGHIYIGGQPRSADAIGTLKAAGVTTIVNLRTPKEISDPEKSPFNEATVSQELGLGYFHLPAGGEDHPFTPAQVDRFAEIVREAPGDILLHCASGRRATHLWVAWLVRSKGMSLDEAVKMGREANLGSQPLEGFLGGKVEYRYTGD